MNLNQYFKHLTIIDQQVDLKDQLITDQELAHNLKADTLLIRFWTTEGIIFGKIDTLLPGYQEAINKIELPEDKILVRKSGGLAVVCDSGILNLSILFSKETQDISDLNETYTFGVELIRYLLKDLNLDIDEGEISNSYCPGKYDLSVKGKKFSGMAQYRTKNTIMLTVTLCINGDQQKRCRIIKDFYDISNTNKDTKYPQIMINSMETLSTLSSKSLTVESIKDNMIKILNQFYSF